MDCNEKNKCLNNNRRKIVLCDNFTKSDLLFQFASMMRQGKWEQANKLAFLLERTDATKEAKVFLGDYWSDYIRRSDFVKRLPSRALQFINIQKELLNINIQDIHLLFESVRNRIKYVANNRLTNLSPFGVKDVTDSKILELIDLSVKTDAFDFDSLYESQIKGEIAFTPDTIPPVFENTYGDKFLNIDYLKFAFDQVSRNDGWSAYNRDSVRKKLALFFARMPKSLQDQLIDYALDNKDPKEREILLSSFVYGLRTFSENEEKSPYAKKILEKANNAPSIALSYLLGTAKRAKLKPDDFFVAKYAFAVSSAVLSALVLSKTKCSNLSRDLIESMRNAMNINTKNGKDFYEESINSINAEIENNKRELNETWFADLPKGQQIHLKKQNNDYIFVLQKRLKRLECLKNGTN